MKQKYYFLQLLLLILSISSGILFGCQENPVDRKDKNTFPLLSRKASLSYPAEWPAVQKKVQLLQEKLKKNPSDTKSSITLTSVFISEARVTGNYDYYHAAAKKLIENIIRKDPDHFEALTFQATILLSEHQFSPALEVAERIKTLYPYNAYVYGLITDAQVELGNYPAAIEAADQMISLRPDIRSYSRIAYIREIHGDIPGAVEAMNLAIEAGAPGDENTEWCRTQLAKLYEQCGKKTEAVAAYQEALQNRPLFPPALAGLAGIAMDEKNFNEALELYLQADSIVSDHVSMEGIAEIYELTGKTGKAARIRDEILERIKKYAGDGKTAKSDGQNEDHEMAHAYMGVGDIDRALDYALTEYQRRPGNIEVNETVAAVHVRKGNHEQALQYIEIAMRTNCKKPELLLLAGEIYSKTGRHEAADKVQKEVAALHHQQ